MTRINHKGTESSTERRRSFFTFFVCFQTVRSRRVSKEKVLFELAKEALQDNLIPGNSRQDRLAQAIDHRDKAGLFSLLDEVVAYYEQDQVVQG